MKVKIFINILILFYIGSSCSEKSNLTKTELNNYNEIRGLYPDKLVKHFPNVESRNVILLDLIFPRGKHLSSILILVPSTDMEIDSLQTALTKEAKCIYHFDDSCLQFINNQNQVTPDCDLLENILPIPSFNSLRDSHFPSSFFQNADIYVLGAEKGKFLKDENLTRTGVGLSEEWAHGYSRGVLISGDIVTYWLEVW